MDGGPEWVRVDQLILLARDDVGLGGSGKKGTVKRHLGSGISRLVGGLDTGHALHVIQPGEGQS